MSPDLLLPVITTLAWLVLCGASLASFRLKAGQMVRMALVWIVIFGGVFVIVQWVLASQGPTSVLF